MKILFSLAFYFRVFSYVKLICYFWQLLNFPLKILSTKTFCPTADYYIVPSVCMALFSAHLTPNADRKRPNMFDFNKRKYFLLTHKTRVSVIRISGAQYRLRTWVIDRRRPPLATRFMHKYVQRVWFHEERTCGRRN